MMKSFAPASSASTTSGCWPMALHISTLAPGSILMMLRTASIPSISGITMSMVTRSGWSSAYFFTASTPFSASPTISKPSLERMSLIIILMNRASSTIRTDGAIRSFLPCPWHSHRRPRAQSLFFLPVLGGRRVDGADVRPLLVREDPVDVEQYQKPVVQLDDSLDAVSYTH